MRNLIKLKVIFLVFSVIFGSISKADQLILPKDKPLVDQETKKVTAKKKFILPKKKPSDKAEKIENIKIKTLSLNKFFINF